MKTEFRATVAKTRDDLKKSTTRTTVFFSDMKSAKVWVLGALEGLGEGSHGKVDAPSAALTGHWNTCAWGRMFNGKRHFPRNNL